MVDAERLLTVLIVCVLTPAESLRVNVSKQVFVVAEERIQVSTGSVNESRHFCGRESVWIKNRNTLGCICDVKNCVPLCCPMIQAASADGCVADYLTTSHFGLEPDIKDAQFSFAIPRDSIESSAGGTNKVEDLVEYEKFFDEDLHLRDYCLFRQPNATRFTLLVCEGQPVREMYGSVDFWLPTVCHSVSVIFKITTLVVYSVVSELNENLQGWILLSFLASDVCNTSLVLLDLVLLSSICLKGNLYIAIGFVSNFCGFAYILWLNVMSFDIWKRFRMIQSVRDPNIGRRKRTAYFIRYSIYVCGTSTFCATIVLYMFDLKMTSYNDSELSSMRFYLFGLPGVIVFVCNTFFYTRTALKINRWRQDTSRMVDGANRHHRENQKWFNLDLKLFVLSGCPMILWAVAYFWNNSIFDLFVHVIEALQGLCIFLIFVCKHDVRDAIRRLFT